jgi:hypothetical protein
MEALLTRSVSTLLKQQTGSSMTSENKKINVLCLQYSFFSAASGDRDTALCRSHTTLLD